MARRWITDRKSDRDQGITTLEVMVLFPAVFAFMLFAIQTAMYHYSRQVVLAAAEEGARTAAQGNPANPASLTPGVTTANTFIVNVGGSWVTGTTDPPLVIADQNTQQPRVRITVVATAISLVPGLTFHISQSADSAFEIFTHG